MNSAFLWYFAARRSAKAMVNPLGKYWNAAAENHRNALRVSLSTPTDFVVPLDKGITIICEARLGNCSCIALLPSIHGHIAVSADKLTETLITTRVEH